MRKGKVLFVFGTRPEAIKLAPLIRELQEQKPRFDVRVVVTAQHRQLLDQVLEIFSIHPDYDLGIMQENQPLSAVLVRALTGLEGILKKEMPDMVVVQGDATSAFAGALAAYYQKIPIAHVEAGLRTNDKYAPWPEEINRRFITALADYHFAPTRMAKDNLLREGVDRKRVYVTGNTVIDALLFIRRHGVKPPAPVLSRFHPRRRLLLLTLHRRESFGPVLAEICRGVALVVDNYPDVEVVYPVHLNPNVKNPVKRLLGGKERIYLVPPLMYSDFVALLSRAYLVLTDSGGVTEEAPALGKPVLILREKTERMEAVAAGVARLVGTRAEKIFKETGRLLNAPALYRRMAQGKSPFGDGRAARRITKILMRVLGSRTDVDK